jgi:UDPglucose 6-dehydrogenase
MNSQYNIGVVGLWHLGETYSASLAELGHNVIGIDENAEVIENFSQNIPPLAEPRLAEMLAAHQASGKLSYSTDFSRLSACNVVWLTLDTSVDDNDEVQTDAVFQLVEKVIPHLASKVLVVVSSQIPVGTSAKFIALIKEKRPEISFGYVYSPENLRLGDAIKCFLEPGRVVGGASDEKALATFKDMLSPLSAEIVSMSPASAEMTKHALNSYLATSISFTNDIADICVEFGADVEDVSRALKSDPRVGPKAYLFAGLGFSGGTLGRDLKTLMKVGHERGVEVPVIASVFAKNQSRNAVVGARLAKELGDISGKTFAMFGVTYKAGTSTLRRSQPLEIEKVLRDTGAKFRLYDPGAKSEEVSTITPSPFFNDPYEAAKGVDGILIMTPWTMFRDFDFVKLHAGVSGSLFFDTCNIVCAKEADIRAAGFNYISIGR